MENDFDFERARRQKNGEEAQKAVVQFENLVQRQRNTLMVKDLMALVSRNSLMDILAELKKLTGAETECEIFKGDGGEHEVEIDFAEIDKFFKKTFDFDKYHVWLLGQSPTFSLDRTMGGAICHVFNSESYDFSSETRRIRKPDSPEQLWPNEPVLRFWIYSPTRQFEGMPESNRWAICILVNEQEMLFIGEEAERLPSTGKAEESAQQIRGVIQRMISKPRIGKSF
jgi:hypothetical protein